MKGLWIGVGAAAVVAVGAVVGVGALREDRGAAKPVLAKVSGPVQGSSFSVPAEKKAAPAESAQALLGPKATPIATPAPVSAVPTPEPTPVQVAAAAASVPEPADGGFAPIKFDILASYKYEEAKPSLGSKPGSPPPTPIPNQIPASVTALDKRKVEIEGYMVPMEVTDDGKVKTFILTKNQPQCCFGDVEAPNEWIDVKMQPDTYTDFLLDRPVRVQGALEVGEKLEDGFLVSLYRMTADKVHD